MTSSTERKVKSLNDIPEVFNGNGHTNSKIVEIPLLNLVSEHFEKSQHRSNASVFEKISFEEESRGESSSFDEEEFIKDCNFDEKHINRENDLKKFHLLDENVENRIDCNSKRNTIESNETLKTISGRKNSHKTVEQKLRKRKRILSTADIFLSLLVFTPMTIGFWKGTWTYMDIHVNVFPGILTLVLGFLVHISFAILKNLLHSQMVVAWRKKTLQNRTLCKIMQILYTYVFGVACNMQWRGSWIIFDRFFLEYIWAIVAVTTVSMVMLTIFRSVRNLLAIPFIVAVDKHAYVFHFPTRYKLNTRDWSLYLLDCAFSVGVVGTLVVFVWRGVWILFDLYLFPDDREYSAIGSLAIGYVIVTVTFSLQPLMRYVCARLQGLARLVAADCFLLLSFLGTVNVWRGIWNVLDLWLVPDNPELSCWITHIGCFVFLVLLNCSNSILVRGVYIDAEEDDGKCVVFPCHYLRLFFKVEREKKEARRRNLLVASKDFRPRADGNAKDTENGALLPNSTATTILPSNPESLV